MNDILDNYVLPGDANEMIRSQGLQSVQLGDGISRLYSGQDGGIAYKFFIHPVRNELKTQAAGYEINDEVEMIQWLKNRRQKPVERVRLLPDALLRFDRDGKCVGGRYMEAYNRWKEGQGVTGLPLEKWGELSVGQVKTLESENIFTVEQYAEWPDEKVRGIFSDEFVEAHKRAKQFVAAKDVRASNEEQVNKMVELEKRASRAEAMLEELMEKQKAAPKRKTRSRKKASTKKKSNPAADALAAV